MQRTTKLDQPAPIQELFPSDQILEEVKMEESGIHPHHEDLHAFVTNMWNTTSQPKSGTATSSEDSKEEVLRWHEENFKVQEEEIRRRKEEVLQARAINKNLERLHRRDKRDLTRANREIDELRRSNISLWEELEDVLSMKRTLDLQQREDQLKMTKVVRERDDLRQTNTTLLKELSAVRAAQKLLLSKKKEEPERSTPPAGILRHKMPRTVSWHKDVDEINYGSEAASCLDDDDLSTLSRKDPLEIVELVRSCLTGTVSRWVKGMQTACNPETVEGLVLPWLLHKLFDLTSQAVRKRRDELLYYFEGGNKADLREAPVGFGHATAHESVVHRRVLSHQLALSGDKLKSTVDTIMISLAHSITDHKDWDRSVQAPETVYGALAESGLEQIVVEYLHIMVYCCLQDPEVTFSDDIGKVESYDPQLHSEIIDGEPLREFCIVVFPALVVIPLLDEEHDAHEQQQTLSTRFVMGTREVVTDV